MILWLFLLGAFVAEVLGTIWWFGSSLFFVPLAWYFLDFHSVLGITALFHVASNITKIWFFRQWRDKKLIIMIGVPAVIWVILGARASKYVNVQILEWVLAIFLICTSLFFLRRPQAKLQPTDTNSIIGWSLSGIVAWLVGTGGAIRGMTLTAFALSTDVFIATSAVIDLGIDASRAVVYALNGYVHLHDLYLIPWLIVVSIAWTYVGKKILEHVSQNQFRKIVLFLILGIGISSLVKLMR